PGRIRGAGGRVATLLPERPRRGRLLHAASSAPCLPLGPHLIQTATPPGTTQSVRRSQSAPAAAPQPSRHYSGAPEPPPAPHAGPPNPPEGRACGRLGGGEAGRPREPHDRRDVGTAAGGQRRSVGGHRVRPSATGVARIRPLRTGVAVVRLVPPADDSGL